MSNKERAAKLLTPNSEHCQRVHNGEGGDPCMFCEYNAETAADMLADAGLLAPDLPEPRIDIDEWQEWGHKHGPSVALENGKITVYIPDDISRDLTPDEARELAEWLNAAANEAKRGQP